MNTANIYKQKKILIIVENLPVPFDRRVWQEALALKERGAEVFIICPTSGEYSRKRETIDGIEIYRHRLIKEAVTRWEYPLEYISALIGEFFIAWWIFFKCGIDIIHACNPPDLIFLIALPFKLFGTKFIFDHHDINPELFLAKYKKKDLIFKLMIMLEKLTFRFADYSIATNESYKSIAINRGRMDPGKVFVVRSGPDLKRLQNVPPDKRYRNGRDYLVGYVGVIGKQEGLNYLIEAIEHIVYARNRKDIQFVCVGSGPDFDNVVRYAKMKKISEYITFTGRIPDRELIKILNTSDLCVNPDEYNEMNDKSTMNKIMEYMAVGKPIVQFNLKEGRATAQAASLYAEPNDSVNLAENILSLIDNPSRRESMGKYGYERIKNELSWDNEKYNLYRVYDEVLGGYVYSRDTARKRVCMVVHEYYPKDFRVRREAEALLDNGYNVDVICLKQKNEKSIDVWNDIIIHRLPVRRHRGHPLYIYIAEYFSFFVLCTIKLLQLFMKKKYDIIHVHNPPDLLVFVGLIPKLLGARIIFDIHDRVPILFISRFKAKSNKMIKNLVNLGEKISIHFADRIIVAVNIYKKMLVEKGYPENKIDVILNSADERYFYIRGNADRVKDGYLKLLYHGTLVSRYGVDTLIEATKILDGKGIGFRLDIYGSGDAETMFKKMINKYGLGEKVFLKGFYLIDYMPDIISKADLCIVPNKKDSFMDTVLPTKLLEYVIMEKPVIISRTEGTVEFFSEEEVTFFSPGSAKELADKIIEFSCNPEIFLKKIRKAKEKYEKISFDKQKNILLGAYGELS
ncbi:MAG: glycosyltransferase family 4 protein [Elusimicrobia bacterium]|nr:glycosyltransferase family 4 protein [Elusimicrobiota bacterium]